MGKSGIYVVCGCVLAVVIVVAAIIISSMKKLNSDEVGLAYNNFQKKLADSTSSPGLHTGPPGFYFIKVPGVFMTINFKSVKCLNHDGVEIALTISYQYRVKLAKLRDIILQFRDFETFKDVLKYAGESAIHDSCSQFNTSQFQAERGTFQLDLRTRLVAKYDDLDTDITDLQVNDLQRPGDYDAAIRKKERAREDIVVAGNERPQALTEAHTKQREAETQADIIIAKALSDARILNNEAAAEAKGIFNQYTEEAVTYKRLISSDGLDLTAEGLLSYVGIRMIQNAQSPFSVSIKAPAKVSYAP